MKWPSDVLLPFITLACYNKCPYCSNRHAPDHNFDFKHLSTSRWIHFINSLEGVESVVFNGGEPALYTGFPELISTLDKFRTVAIGTNYSSRSTEQLLRIKPYPSLSIDGSFHPHCQTFDEVSGNILQLLDHGFRVRVHLVDYPGHTTPPALYLEGFRALDIDCFLHPFQGWFNGRFYPDDSFIPMCSLKSRSRVECARSQYLPIAPDGNIYFCHYLMYAQNHAGIVGHIEDEFFAFPLTMPCDHFGFCNPCDYLRETSPLPPTKTQEI